MAGKYRERALGALAGIYGNDAEETVYPSYMSDESGQLLDGSKHNYEITFPAGQMPPVDAFWSVIMYDGKTRFLVANPLNRYLINSPMASSLKKQPDGSITLYLQHAPPGKNKEANLVACAGRADGGSPEALPATATGVEWRLESAADTKNWRRPLVVMPGWRQVTQIAAV